ncbi:MAG: hypothetical protein PHI93_10870 [Kiritimatiellae bacterium]|nr:hypothetical protein [Kiritimatiellia bacterium]
MPTPSILLDPVTFAEALADRDVRSLLPNSLTSRELQELAPSIRNRANFSARVESSRHLTVLDNITRMILDPDQNPDGTPRAPGQYMNEARARSLLRDHLDQLGYTPDPADINTIKDLRSTQRIRLQLEMPVSFARNYGHALQTNDPAILDAFPGQRLLPSYAAQPRPDIYWNRRWKAAGLPGPFGSDYVALKSDPGWARLSTFGNPYPPFSWGSRREVEDVERELCEEYGLITPDQTAEPMSLPERPLTAALPEASPTLMQAILAQFPNATFENGTLTQLT